MYGVFLFFLAFFCVPFLWGGLSLAPWVPTFRRDHQRLIDIIKDTPGKTILEIGCGDGGVSRALARAFPERHIIGVEIVPYLAFYAWICGKIQKLPNYTILSKSALKLDFRTYDIFYLYGLPETLAQKILPKFQNEASKGSMLISYVFSFPKEFAGRIQTLGGEKEAKFHILEK